MSLSEFAGPERLDIAARAALISDSVLSGGPGALSVILGAGLAVSPGFDLRPIIVVDRNRVDLEQGWRDLHEVDEALKSVVVALGGEPAWLRQVRVLVLDPPEPHVGPSDRITSPKQGTIGCKASWTGGTGFLTAGHVAPTKGSSVFNGSTPLGTVRFTSDPSGGGTVPSADVSLVELGPKLTWSSAHGPPVAAAPSTAVTVLSGRPKAGIIVGFLTFFYWASVSGTYADTYLTSSYVSSGGDSGSAVIDGNGDVVGLVVGGTKGIASFIQDVRYLIRQMSRFPNLSTR